MELNKAPREEANKEDKKEIKYTSLYIDEETGMFAEQVYDGENVKFCVYNTKTQLVSYSDTLDFEEVTIKPINDEEISKKAILLPSKAEEYGTDKELDKEIIEYISKWLDIPDDAKQFALWNIKRSWVYERFHTLNYLRALGDTGGGKTRYLDTLGSIHYKPINTSGATTSAPVFRIIDKWKGTLVMDEADFKQSDESQDIIKIINQGFERGKHIMRCDQNNATKISFFDPFCPKILATRRVFQDKATESRCITNVMTGTERKDIPLNLNKAFFEATLKLRNKLLMWRFKNYYKIDPDKKVEFDIGKELEPRVKQIIGSFISLFGEDKGGMEMFKKYITNYQEELIDERKDSFAGTIVEGVHSLLGKMSVDISSQDIITESNITNKKGEFVKPRGISSTLRALGFGKSELRRIDGSVKRCIPLEEKHLKNLFKRYGLETNVVTNVTVVTVVTDGSIESSIGNEGDSKKTDLPSKSSESKNSEVSVTTVTTVTPLPEKELTDDMLIEFVREAKLYDMNAFSKKYGENRMKKILQNGDVYEKKPGCLAVLE